MKKLGRLSAAAFSFATIANNSFAASMNKDNTSLGFGDIVPFALGALLIVCVLLIGYKMDKSAENAPTIKKQKVQNKKAKNDKKEREGVKEYSETEEAQIYAEENKADIPYEADENEYYDSDSNFDYSGLNDDVEYEEDDVSLFSSENNQESSFDDIDDNISYEVESIEEPIKEEDDFEYSDAIEGLDEKIDSLDDINEDGTSNSVSELVKDEEQDAQSFMNELNKYKAEAEQEEEEFPGFTTKSYSKAELKKGNNPKRYTMKKYINETSNEVELPELLQVEEDSSSGEESYNDIEPYSELMEEQFIEAPSGQMDIGFLNQMEQNLKKNQEERIRKAGIDSEKSDEEEPKKRGRKPKDQ